MNTEMPCPTDERDAFKVFAVSLYDRPGLSQKLIKLQDSDGVDINIVLFICYLVVNRGWLVDECALEKMNAFVAPLRDDVIVPLRSLRRRLKAMMENNEAIADAYKATLAAEIEAEFTEQALLARSVADFQPGSDAPCLSDMETGVAVEVVLRRYFGLLHVTCNETVVETIGFIAQEAIFCAAFDGNS